MGAVSLSALEQALEDHPAVDTALSTALEHLSLGADVVLGYVPAGTGGADTQVLRAFLATRLPGRRPTRILR